MVDNIADDVAIVHQIPFTCDRIYNSTEQSTENLEDPSLFLQIDGKNQCYNRKVKQQHRFVATLEKVYNILKICEVMNNC